MYKSILYYKHSIIPTCFDHSHGHPQGGVKRHYKSLWNNAQI